MAWLQSVSGWLGGETGYEEEERIQAEAWLRGFLEKKRIAARINRPPRGALLCLCPIVL